MRVFEWDPARAASNIRKHGIRFDDAAVVFDDPFVQIEQDRIVSGELRWQAIGLDRGFILTGGGRCHLGR